MKRSLRDMASLATPMCLRVAATLQLADAMGTTGATASELAEQTKTSVTALTKVLDHLVSVDVFQRSGDRYLLTDLGQQLYSDCPDNLLAELDINSWLGRAELSFTDLLHTVTTGLPAYPRRYGQKFWADLAANPAIQKSFDNAMAHRFSEHAPQIAQRFDWSRFPTIVDVGGGTGTVLSAILSEHPDVTGQLIDLPSTAEHATASFVAGGLAGRATAIAGSFFEPLPAGADAYLLCDILHDWDDKHAHTILSHCAQAAGIHGSVLVIEPLRGIGANTTIDLSMLVFFGGCERSIEELAELASAHNLRLKNVVQLSEGRTLLEFVNS